MRTADFRIRKFKIDFLPLGTFSSLEEEEGSRRRRELMNLEVGAVDPTTTTSASGPISGRVHQAIAVTQTVCVSCASCFLQTCYVFSFPRRGRRRRRKRHKTFLRVCKLEISFQTLFRPAIQLYWPWPPHSLLGDANQRPKNRP